VQRPLGIVDAVGDTNGYVDLGGRLHSTAHRLVRAERPPESERPNTVADGAEPRILLTGTSKALDGLGRTHWVGRVHATDENVGVKKAIVSGPGRADRARRRGARSRGTLLAARSATRYNQRMIRSFRHKGVERFFKSGSRAGIQAAHAPCLARQLSALDVATRPEDMNRPGWDWHPLKGALSGHWSVSVNDNWRLTFAFENGDAILVDYQDYH